MKANAPDKIYVHEASAPELTEKLPYHIEYTRTDAFIEKAKQWLRCNNDLIDGDVADYVESFENYIKGE